jgi:hypothetical protein
MRLLAGRWRSGFGNGTSRERTYASTGRRTVLEAGTDSRFSGGCSDHLRGDHRTVADARDVLPDALHDCPRQCASGRGLFAPGRLWRSEPRPLRAVLAVAIDDGPGAHVLTRVRRPTLSDEGDILLVSQPAGCVAGDLPDSGLKLLRVPRVAHAAMVDQVDQLARPELSRPAGCVAGCARAQSCCNRWRRYSNLPRSAPPPSSGWRMAVASTSRRASSSLPDR